MVTRRSTQSVTQRSTRSSELHMTRRPRRLVPPKTVDDTVGLSRKEERELKKALYASLQETRRNRSAQSEVDESPTPDGPLKTRKSIRQAALMSGATASVKRGSMTGNVGVDESSQDSMISSRSQASSVESKKKIQAQRKFAQGCSAPCTPSTTPNKKAAHSPHNLLDRIPKTEDFLTFLCLRGSHILPPHLDFFNFARDGASGEDSSSRPRTPVGAEQPGNAEQTRESTPESSSSGSNLAEELVEISTFSTPSRQLLASSKAARASAGTPETARGIVSLRQGLTRKVVHTGSTPPSQHSKKYFYTPEKTPSPAGSRLLYGEFTPAKKSASIKCLPASFLRFSPAGKLALDRNGNPPRLTSSKSSASHSPGDRSKGKRVSHRGERQPTAAQNDTEKAKDTIHRRSPRNQPVNSAFKKPSVMPLRARRSDACLQTKDSQDDAALSASHAWSGVEEVCEPNSQSAEFSGTNEMTSRACTSDSSSEQGRSLDAGGRRSYLDKNQGLPSTTRHPSSPYESAFLQFLSIRDPGSELTPPVPGALKCSTSSSKMATPKAADQILMARTKGADVKDLQVSVVGMSPALKSVTQHTSPENPPMLGVDKTRNDSSSVTNTQGMKHIGYLSPTTAHSGLMEVPSVDVKQHGSRSRRGGAVSQRPHGDVEQDGSSNSGSSLYLQTDSSPSTDVSDSSSNSSSQPWRMPTGTFKPVEPAKSKGHRDPRSAKSSASPVRRILEGASKKLVKKAHGVDRKAQDGRPRRDTKSQKKKHKLHVNAASTVSGTSGGGHKRAKPKVVPKRSHKSRDERKKSQQQEKIIRMKRRTSQRLKTLAKILGRKRPNYSLVVSGYADMEEYEEEQKKKAAKSALAKAKAEARARASTKVALPKQPSKVMTRSSSVSSGKDVVSSAKDVMFSAKDTLDKSDKKSPPLKRPAPATPKKEQSNLASIIEHKRLRRDSAKEDSGDASSVGSKDSSKETGSRSVSSSPTAKKVTPKKSQQEKSTPMSVPSPDPALAHLDPIPTFHPTEDEFSDPISYIASISDQAEPVGMCRIIPPASWKMESKVNEEIRFTTQIQHLHRLFNRWGPGVEQSRAITHHLRDVMMDHNTCIPQIGGVEVDLPQLYRMIRDLGGLQNIVDKKQWVKVADAMKIPKAAHDRVTRLYDVYCKYVLPYAMVTEVERQQAQTDVHTQYELSSAEDEAILRGKSMTLSCFSRIARNVQSMWFKDDPNPDMVEAAYWKIVKERDTHVAVQCAHVDTRAQSTAFPTRRESPYFRHSWNLNNLPENKKCILKCLGPVSGATIPTLHVGMLFSTSCWSTDPHRLPYVQYLHSGANTIWYCIPKNDVAQFHDVMKEICPTLLHNDPLWLKEDIAMVKPDELTSRGVHVARCVQQPRQFVVVFPDAYTATVCCGYNVSESVHYATTDWLSLGIDAAKALCASGEKELFSVDTLVCGLCQDSSDLDTLAAALPLIEIIVARELEERHQLSAAGLRCERRLAVEDSPGTSTSLARKRTHDLTEDSVCEVCFKICYLSMVLNEHDEQILCLEHGLRHVQRKRHVKAAKLFYRYTEEELTELVQATKDRLTALTNGSAANAVAKKRAAVKRQDSKT